MQLSFIHLLAPFCGDKVFSKKTITLKTIKNHTTSIEGKGDIKINGLYGIYPGVAVTTGEPGVVMTTAYIEEMIPSRTDMLARPC